MSQSSSSNGWVGVGAGYVLAVTISYSTHHHIGWAMLHGFFGWFYVLYYYLSGSWQGVMS
jgi:hypothetical protein